MKVAEDFLGGGEVGDEGEDGASGAAGVAAQDVHAEGAAEEFGPGDVAEVMRCSLGLLLTARRSGRRRAAR